MHSFSPRVISQDVSTTALLVESGASILVYAIYIFNIGTVFSTDGLDITNGDESETLFEAIVLNLGGAVASTKFSSVFNMTTPFIADNGLRIGPPDSGGVGGVRALVFYSNVGA